MVRSQHREASVQHGPPQPHALCHCSELGLHKHDGLNDTTSCGRANTTSSKTDAQRLQPTALALSGALDHRKSEGLASLTNAAFHRTPRFLNLHSPAAAQAPCGPFCLSHQCSAARHHKANSASRVSGHG